MELKQTYKPILDSMYEAVYVIDRDMAIQYANPASEKLTGYSLSESLGRKCHEIFCEKSFMCDGGCPPGRAIREQIPTLHREAETKRKDGEMRQTQISFSPFYEKGECVGAVIVINDIPERKRAEEQLLEMNRRLEERVREEAEKRLRQERLLIQQSKMAAMGEMIGAIAHQWRQPLTALGLIIQDIDNAYAFNEIDKDYIDRIIAKSMEQVRFMSRTIDDFRNFFKPSKERSTFDVMLAIRDVLILFSAQMRLYSLRYRLTCHVHHLTFEDITEVTHCHELLATTYENEFKQVVLNIVNNAKDAIMERRGKGLMGHNEKGLLCMDFYSEGDRITIKISDNGGGIPEKIRHRIFEPYFTTKEAGRGTGIGLYMAKVIIENSMGGRLYAENTGEGACFTIELPRPAAPAGKIKAGGRAGNEERTTL